MQPVTTLTAGHAAPPLSSESGASLDAGVSLHRAMTRLRLISTRMVDLQRSERVAFHASAIGEEATIAGATLAARECDWIFPGTREWGAAVLRGLTLRTYVSAAFGNADDPRKGHAPPDSAASRALHIAPPSGITGAHVVQAVGLAWAARTKKDDLVAIALFGDGATSTGDFHNALNFAGVFKAPVVFVCRNNGHATSTPTSRQTRTETFAEKAVAYGIASARVDGQDALAVHAVVQEAIARAAAGKGATLVEAVTEPEGRDPIALLQRTLEEGGRWDAAAADAWTAETTRALDEAVAAAERVAAPTIDAMFEDVYAEVPAHLQAQRREAAAWRR